MKHPQGIGIWRIATGVCLGLFAAQFIPVAINEMYYAAYPCDRPNLDVPKQTSCDLDRILAKTKQQNKEWEEKLKAEKEADNKFAKEHPVEWKAKKDKEAAELKAFQQARQDKQAEWNASWAKIEQDRKDDESRRAAESKKRSDEWEAEKASWKVNLDEQIAISAQNQTDENARLAEDQSRAAADMKKASEEVRQQARNLGISLEPISIDTVPKR
jgi:hypothetical protein